MAATTVRSRQVETPAPSLRLPEKVMRLERIGSFH